ncbi:MAG: carboxylesterase family protein [Syntrophaceae bacterium]
MYKHASFIIAVVLLGGIMFFSGCNSSSDSNPGSAPAAAQSPESSQAADNPLVRQTVYGTVQGIEEDCGTWAWLGVPYAKPPLGSLRWRAPRDPEKWSGVRNAGKFCSYCPQYGNYLSETGRDTMGGYVSQGVATGNEDCLYLNIWRPATSEQKLPVYVFIHGGANIIGRSDLSIYNGAHFAARENMLFVTINYRLGFFGWFWHPALKVKDDPLDNSGNYGTLDIIKSLQWIHDNIAAFGGDPNNVTITGQSAGGMNVYSMMTSPLAKGLFHRAIAHSGASQACYMSRAVQKAKATLRRLLKQDGYTSDDIDDLTKQGNEAWIRSYLRSKTMEEIYDPKNCGPLTMPLDGIPTVETIMGVYIDGTVIPTSPLLSFYNGTYNQVPLMMSCTKEEMKLFIPMIIMEPLNLWQVVYDFDPNHPDIDLGDYLSPWSYPLMPLYAVGPAAGQALFQGFGTDTMAPLAKKYQDDVYVYKFLWDDEPAPFDYLIGAGHAMDLPFVFGNFITDKSSLCNFAWSDANQAGREILSEAMMDYLGQFARTGNPNGGNPVLPVWLPWSSAKDSPKRMTFDSAGIVMSNEYLEPEELCVSCEAHDMLNMILTLMGFTVDS